MTLRDLQTREPPLILASASVARCAILSACGLVFTVIEPRVEEDEIKRRFRRDGRQPAEAALALAEAKAADVAMHHPDALVIGADQILSSDDDWFDKPRSLEEARQQLGRLRGHVQRLHTAVVLRRDTVTCWTHLAVPEITLRLASDALLDAYVATEGTALLSCVGACRIEGPGPLLIERIVGEQAAILGLPLLSLLAALRGEGVLPA